MILLEILYILELEVNVCRLLMVRGINNSVRKCSHLLYRWDRNSIACKCSPSANVDGDFYHERKVIYGDTAGIFLYKKIIEKKKKRYGKCNTIVIGLFAGKENAFLIQNAFPIIKKYFDHVHTVQKQPVTVHKKLDKLLVKNLNEVLAMNNRGINLIFTDIKAIRAIMEKELNK